MDKGPRLNHQINAYECRLIGEDGHAYGVILMEEARRISHERGLDLVEVSPNAKPPVVRLIDYGKFKYESQKKANEAKKRQVVIAVKEIQFRPHIDQHDLETKLKKAQGFLEQGDKIKLVMQFRGRELAYKDAGLEKFQGIIAKLVENGAVIEAEAKMMGNRILAMVAPDKKIMNRIAEQHKQAARMRAQKKVSGTGDSGDT